MQARPSLDQTGYFEMPEPPGFAGSLSDHKDKTGGRPELPDKAQKIADARRMKDEGNSYRDISKVLGVSIGWLSTNLKEATV
jgi:DNA invertase Pin-like site-specific DNA recombinase